MTPKEWMQNVRQLMMLLRAKSESLQNIRDVAERITGVTSGIRVQGGDPSYSRVEQGAIVLADMYDDAIEELDSFIRGINRAKKAINEVEDARYRAVLELRYIACKTWEEIAEAMHYDVSWVGRLHGSALVALGKTEAYRQVVTEKPFCLP